MADFFVAAGTPVTNFDATTGAFLTAATTVELTITDGSTDNVFLPNEGGFLMTVSGITNIVEYLGVTEIGGVDYPVFRNIDQDRIAVFGYRAPNSTTFPDVASLNIQAENLVVPCFLTGTQIATPDRARAVEDLSIGDLILTADGRAVAVKWVGHKRVLSRFGSAERLMPVRIRAGALGNGLPQRDLYVTADHGLWLDGVMVEAGALVGALGVARVPLSEFGESYTVYHIETEGHQVILAEGQPAETYVDYDARRGFDNYPEYVALYGEEVSVPEMNVARVSTPDHLPSHLKARLGFGKVA